MNHRRQGPAVKDTTMRVVVSALVAVVAVCGSSAHAEPVKRPLVFVADIAPTAGLEADAAAVTASLCSALAKDKRLDVLCAPDIRQILSFAAMSTTAGANPATSKLEARLESLDYVVTGTISARGKEEIALVVAVGPRDPDGDFMAPSTTKPLVKIEEVAAGKAHRLLDRLADIASRLTQPMLATSAAQTTAPTTAPPAPLPPKK